MEPMMGHVLRAVHDERFGNVDCTNGGITSKANYVLLFPCGTTKTTIEQWCMDCAKRHFEHEHPEPLEDYSPDEDTFLKDLKEKCVVLERGGYDGTYTSAQVVFKKDGGPYCAGGNYIIGDSRFSEMVGHPYPVPVHDRWDTWNNHYALGI